MYESLWLSKRFIVVVATQVCDVAAWCDHHSLHSVYVVSVYALSDMLNWSYRVYSTAWRSSLFPGIHHLSVLVSIANRVLSFSQTGMAMVWRFEHLSHVFDCRAEVSVILRVRQRNDLNYIIFINVKKIF